MSARPVFLQRFGGTEADSSAPLVDSQWPTTRTFPRSLHGPEAAFPGTAEYASPIERHAGPPSLRERICDALWWLGAFVLIGAVGALVEQLMR